MVLLQNKLMCFSMVPDQIDFPEFQNHTMLVLWKRQYHPAIHNPSGIGKYDQTSKSTVKIKDIYAKKTQNIKKRMNRKKINMKEKMTLLKKSKNC